MNNVAPDFLTNAMAGVDEVTPASTYAPSNIALSKYWGKRDSVHNLPLNSSVSVSLGQWGTHTEVAPSSGGDSVTHNGNLLAPEAEFTRRTLAFVELFRQGRDLPVTVTTTNSVPTAAGLASSASGFAALTRALCGAFGLGLSETEMSVLARYGSGSATRSLWHGFVRWNKGTQADGSDSHGVPLDLVWPQFRIGILAVDTGEKPQSSRNGMNHTASTSPLFATWPDTAESDCQSIEQAIRSRDFEQLGPKVEANALAMHATMLAARPSLAYLTSRSWQILERLWLARGEGLGAFATMDAGPNVKLIFLKGQEDDVSQVFPEVEIVDPFGDGAADTE